METLERLRQVPLFRQLIDADFALIEAVVRRARYLAGALVCHQGDLGSALYIVDSGAIEVRHVDSRNRQRTLEFKRAGDCFGEAALLVGEPYKTTYIAREDSDLLVIHREDLHDLLLQHPALRPRLYAAAPPDIVTKLNQTHFAWLMEGELTILHARKHWWAFVQELPRALVWIGGALILAIAAMVFRLDAPVIAIVWAIALVIVGLTFAFLIIDWRNDDYLITNRRVIHMERVLLVRTEQREATMDKVQDVKISQPSFFHKLIGVSDVVISTAAVYGTITFATVGNGPAIRDKLFEQIQRTQAQKMFEARTRLKDEIRNQFERAKKPAVIRPTTQSVTSAMSPKLPPRPWQSLLAERLALRYEYAGTITWRKHQIALIWQAWKPVVGILVGLVGVALTLFSVLPPITSFILGAALLFCVGWFIWEWIDWGNDIYMVTKDRIVDLERNPLGVIQHSTEAPLTAINNISYRQPNIGYVLLGVGDVVIETASQTGSLCFPWMSAPAQVANEISQYVERARERQRQAQRAQQRADMFDWFGAYHEYLEDDDRLRRRASSDDSDDAPNQMGT